MSRVSAGRTAGIAATMVAGFAGTAPDLLKLGGAGPAVTVVAGAVVVYLIYLEVRNYPEARGRVFKMEQDTYPYMCKVIQQESPAIYSVAMSYANRSDVRDVLRKRAGDRSLTLLLPRMIPFAEELQKLGARVHVYDPAGSWEPQSRFTIVRHSRSDAEMYYGHARGDRFVIERFRAEDGEPAYWLARDLIDYVRRTAPANP